MNLIRFGLPALAGAVLLVNTSHAANYASSVVSYNPGTGFATEFGSGLGYTNTAAVLGSPSRVTPGDFGGPVDPFSPPYLSEQLLSIGDGGALTVFFSTPILNNPANAYGMDFLIFGSTGFIITNGDFGGGGITDGSTFSSHEGTSRIYVSADDVTYYLLDPALAPGVDTMFPTDGSGDFSIPVDPSLEGSDFADLGLAGIRNLYAGSGGGTGFDLSWAVDGNNQSVNLSTINYIRIEITGGHAEIDGISAVPEPATWALGIAGAALLFARQRRRS